MSAGGEGAAAARASFFRRRTAVHLRRAGPGRRRCAGVCSRLLQRAALERFRGSGGDTLQGGAPSVWRGKWRRALAELAGGCNGSRSPSQVGFFLGCLRSSAVVRVSRTNAPTTCAPVSFRSRRRVLGRLLSAPRVRRGRGPDELRQRVQVVDRAGGNCRPGFLRGAPDAAPEMSARRSSDALDGIREDGILRANVGALVFTGAPAFVFV